MEARDQIRSNDILAKLPLLNGLKPGEKAALLDAVRQRRSRRAAAPAAPPPRRSRR